MKEKYKIRQATANDITQIRQLIRESVADQKSLVNPSAVTNSFMEEFVDKVIEKGNMVVVENDNEVMELIGEIHLYHPPVGNNSRAIKELAFLSRKAFIARDRETELVSWLYGEIQDKHQDVFRVELEAPVCSYESVNHFRQMGLRVEGHYTGRLSPKSSPSTMMVPLSWINAARN